MFSIPDSRLVSVKFLRDGTKYSATIPKPPSYDALLVAMLKRKVAARMIVGVDAVKEFAPPQR